MKLICPNCQKELTVPDQYAGQVMKCPLCAGTFTAPSLTPAVAAAPPPAGDLFNFAAEPPPAPAQSVAPLPPSQPPPPPRDRDTAKAPPPPSGPSDYVGCWQLHFSPQVVGWMAPLCLILVFVLSFFPWVSVPKGKTVEVAMGWEVGGLAITGLVLATLAMMFAGVVQVLTVNPSLLKLPPAIEPLWQWRSAVVGLLGLLALILLVVQLLAGFSAVLLERKGEVAFSTMWMTTVLALTLAAVVAAFVQTWLERRAPGRPRPRLRFEW